MPSRSPTPLKPRATRVVVIGLLDTLEYLRRGGRISGALGAVGEMLSIKPVVTVEDGGGPLDGQGARIQERA